MSRRTSHRLGPAGRAVWRITLTERAFFDDGYMGYVIVLGAIAILAAEPTAKTLEGSGTVTLLDFLIVGPLQVFLAQLLIRASVRNVRRRSPWHPR
jgi:hypothetical protein